MRIAVTTVAMPPLDTPRDTLATTREQPPQAQPSSSSHSNNSSSNRNNNDDDAAVLKYAWPACVLFQSFHRNTNFHNVDYLLITRNPGPQTLALAAACNITIRHRRPAIPLEAVQDPEYKRLVQPGGQYAGIGLMDFDFLWPWSFEEYDRVLILDVDMLVMNNIDHLFVLPSHLLFTNGMFSSVNGGFQLIQPSMSIFKQMQALITAPRAFRPETGWYRTGLQHGRTHGAATLQGFLTYFVRHVFRDKAQELPRALYNCQFDAEIEALALLCDHIYLAHFTACPKPMQVSASTFIQQATAHTHHLCACAFFYYKTFQIHLIRTLLPDDLAALLRNTIPR